MLDQIPTSCYYCPPKWVHLAKQDVVFGPKSLLYSGRTVCQGEVVGWECVPEVVIPYSAG